MVGLIALWICYFNIPSDPFWFYFDLELHPLSFAPFILDTGCSQTIVNKEFDHADS